MLVGPSSFLSFSPSLNSLLSKVGTTTTASATEATTATASVAATAAAVQAVAEGESDRDRVREWERGSNRYIYSYRCQLPICQVSANKTLNKTKSNEGNVKTSTNSR